MADYTVELNNQTITATVTLGSGITAFTDMTDTPSTYVGQAGKFVKVNSGETGLEFATSSASVAWGSITGTLSDQTDLQAALDAGVSDGDKGDITVSSSGTVWTVDNNVVTFAKMQDVATNRILGRSTAGTGDIEALADADARTIMGLSTSDSPQFTAINVGHATDTTVARTSAGRINVEGTEVILSGDNISSLTNDSAFISNLVEDTTPQLGGNLDLNSNDITGNGQINLTNSQAENSIKLTPTGDAGNSTSTGGALNITNTSNVGSGIIVYSNAGATATGRLMNIRADNVLFPQTAFHIDYDGTANAAEIVNNSTDTSSQALNVVSNNPNDTTLGINGVETAKGTMKIVHTGTGSDSSASAISIDLQGTGTASQGIYVDATEGGTTGNLLRLRNNNSDVFVVDSTGEITTGSFDADNLTITNIGSSEVKTELITGLTEDTSPDGANDYVMTYDNSATALKKVKLNNLRQEEVFEFALSDETTALTTGTAKLTWRAPFAFTLNDVRASVTTAPTGANLNIDINEGGVSIFSTVLSIDATEKTSTTATTAAVISDSSIADDAEITFDIDQVGSTVAGAGLKVKLYVTRV